jgi:hypothetical protein
MITQKAKERKASGSMMNKDLRKSDSEKNAGRFKGASPEW